MIIYQRSHKFKNLNELNGTLQWFSLEPSYGINSYGDMLTLYILKDDAKLLDIGRETNRKLLVKLSKEKHPQIDVDEILDPDEQYSGGAGNKKAHSLIKMLIGTYYDGTIIDDAYSDDHLKGPSEIVLWNLNLIEKI